MESTTRLSMLRRVHVTLMIAVLALLASTQDLTAQYAGSKRSDKYHLSSCHHAQRIHSENLIVWRTIDDAVSDGYIACSVCRPGSSNSSRSVQGQSSVISNVQNINVSTNRQTKTRCIAITQKGTQCKRNAKSGSYYCWQHGR